MVASLSQENAHLLTVSTPSSSSSSRDQISIARVISRVISELERLGFLTVCFNCKHLSPAANSVPLLPTKKKQQIEEYRARLQSSRSTNESLKQLHKVRSLLSLSLSQFFPSTSCTGA